MINSVRPYEIGNKIFEEAAEIMENLGRLSDFKVSENLCRTTMIKSVYSSFAVDNFPLSFQTVKDIIEGKKAAVAASDASAVKNAFVAYGAAYSIDPLNINDFFKIYSVMTGSASGASNNLIIRSGAENKGNHSGESLTSDRLKGLFEWLNSDAHMLIKSCVCHYELVSGSFDGAGRMGRLWQSLLLCALNPIFACMSVESVINNNKEEYFRSIKFSESEGNVNAFMSFMFSAINKAVKEFSANANRYMLQGGAEDPEVVFFNGEKKCGRLVGDALKVISEHYSEKISASTVAKMLFISPSRLMHKFKTELNLTFNECLTNYRIIRAKELLRSRKFDVSETASAVGFSDARYFCTVFKNATGVSPGEYARGRSGIRR